MPWLALGFFLTALLYASIGFGGGSTYNALLALAGTDYRILPAISLVCNIIVVSGGTYRFARAGFMPWKRALPLVLVAAPFAWAGGLTPIKEQTFLAVLAISLAVTGVTLLFQREASPQDEVKERPLHGGDIALAGGLGYLAGLVGIGGGIFLAPWLHFSRWSNARAIAATASLFILVNSVSGLISQALKLAGNGQTPALFGYWPLAIGVAVGGLIGNHLGIHILPPKHLRRLTALLILYVAAQLIWKLFLA